ncbi:hypothetical protein B0H13DRAFT_1934329 [Mycena leptocephala]|nr:hypothetical protein B0H13DRAFT_1934329 [Mycena leptocephala]
MDGIQNTRRYRRHNLGFSVELAMAEHQPDRVDQQRHQTSFINHLPVHAVPRFEIVNSCPAANPEAMVEKMEMRAFLVVLGNGNVRADILVGKSEYPGARQIYSKIVKTSPRCSPRLHAYALCWIAWMDILMDGEVAGILLCSSVAAELQLYRGDIQNARAASLECLSKSRGTQTDIADNCLAALADPASRMHETFDTFRWAVVYLAFVPQAKDPIGILQALRRLADSNMSLEDDETALHLFHTALESGTKMHIHRLRAECMVGIGEIMLRRDDSMKAMENLGAAYPLFSRSSHMKDAASVKNRQETLCQKGKSLSVRAIRDGADESTGSMSFDFERSGSPPDAQESSFKKLENLLALSIYPSRQVKIAVEPGTSHNENLKLPVVE